MVNKIKKLASLGFCFVSTAFGATNYLMLNLPSQRISAYPHYPVYVYKTAVDGKQHQVAYIMNAGQQVFLSTYDQQTSGNYHLYYSDVNKGRLLWYTCAVVLKNGEINSPATTCPSAAINQLPAVIFHGKKIQPNVYSLGIGANQPWGNRPVFAPTPYPVQTSFSDRQLIFVNHTRYKNIQIGESCSTSAQLPCQTTTDLARISRGHPYVLHVNIRGLDSAAFYVTKYEKKNGDWVNTGGYRAGALHAYATKVESMIQPVVQHKNGLKTVKATNIDVSAVDGYNFAVILFPESPTYCTYTMGAESSNMLGVGYYGQKSPLASMIPTTRMSLMSLCSSSSQLPLKSQGVDGAWSLDKLSPTGDFEGCYSPCSYAIVHNLDTHTMDRFCCSGNHGTPTTCKAPPKSSYVTQLHQHSKNIYSFGYDDANGDYGCPAQTNFVIEFVSHGRIL